MKKCLEVSLFALLVLASAMSLKALTVSSSIGNTTWAQHSGPVPR